MHSYLAALSLKNSETVLGILVIFLMLSVVVLLCASPWIDWFRQELKYINIEIDRHKENPREQARWKRRKRRLLMSLIPFIKYE